MTLKHTESDLSAAFAAELCRAVAELPDRTSPEDWPEAMLVTSDELIALVRPSISAALAKGREEVIQDVIKWANQRKRDADRSDEEAYKEHHLSEALTAWDIVASLRALSPSSPVNAKVTDRGRAKALPIDDGLDPAPSSPGEPPPIREATAGELRAQRESWVRGEMAIGTDRDEAEYRAQRSPHEPTGETE